MLIRNIQSEMQKDGYFTFTSTPHWVFQLPGHMDSFQEVENIYQHTADISFVENSCKLEIMGPCLEIIHKILFSLVTGMC